MTLAIRISRTPDGVYRACCPGLPGCVTWSRSRAEASRSIRRAVNGYLASLAVTLPRELGRLAAAS